jgi:hypothetical protein
MISFNPPAASPLAAAPDLKGMADILAVIADPKAATERLQQLSLATETCRTMMTDAKTQLEALATAKAAHQAALDKAAKDHDAVLVKAAGEFDSKRQTTEKALADREAAVAARESKVAADAEAAATLKADYEGRIARIKAAAS